MKTLTITRPDGTELVVDYTTSGSLGRGWKVDYFSIEAPADVVITSADEDFVLRVLEEIANGTRG
jgi:hypothetical protein